MFTRQHYNLIANGFATSKYSKPHRKDFFRAIQVLADIFEFNNPHFSRDRFLDACTPTEES